MNKKAFSLVEIIISISIIIILWIVATTTSNNLKNNSNNAKVIADLNTISNALTEYKNENKMVVMPGGNNNNFKIDWSYNHSYVDSETYWVYGSFTQYALEKRYLDITPIDPRSNSYYSYWITKNTNFFEIAWVIWEKDNYVAKVIWDYTAENWLYSLIREYNWADYVIDKESNLPYNPEEKKLIATTADWTIYKEWDKITNNSWDDLEIFFSDGSTSIIESGSILTLEKLDFPKENNLVSSVKLFLQAWSIWTNATRLWTESSFDIYTSDITASVRWTIFKVAKQTYNTKVIVVEWSVLIKNWNPSTNLQIDVEKWLEVKTIDADNTPILDNSDIVTEPTTNIIQPLFSSTNTQINNTEEDISNVIENNIYDEVLVAETNKSCFLEWIEVKNWDNILAYDKKYVDYWHTCNNPITKTCSNWVLSWLSQYKYSSCFVKLPNQCVPYNDDWFIWWNVTNEWELDTVTKNESIKLWWFNVWTKTITRTVECKQYWAWYTIVPNDTDTITCNFTNWFTDDWSWWCKCTTWKSFYNWDWSCYENPFGVDYELVKVVDEINSTTGAWFNGTDWYNNNYYWLTNTAGQWKLWIDLWGNFWLVFDTSNIGSWNELVYFYDDFKSKKYLSSKLLKIRLFDNSGAVIKNSIESSNENIKIKFEWDSWNEISWILSKNQSWTNTIDFNWNYNLKLINVKNLKIYKKTSSSSSGWSSSSSSSSGWSSSSSSSSGWPVIWQTYSWYGCSSCPYWSEKSWSSCFWHKYEKCSLIVWDNVCAEKNFCIRGNKNWSWIYK